MKLLLAIVVIAVISLIGARLSFHRRRLPLGVRTMLSAGTEYILLGVLLGSSGLELLDPSTLTTLEPLVYFALAWIGFLIGLQFNSKELRKLPLHYFSITLVTSVVTFVLVSASITLLLRGATSFSWPVSLTAAFVLGSTASATSPSVLAIVARSHKFENLELAGLLRYISGVDALFALLLLALALAIAPHGGDYEVTHFTPLKWLAISAAAGVIPAVILIALNRAHFSHQEFILFLTGTVIFCAGLATHGGQSPLVSGLVCGLITANACRHRTRALSVVGHAERSFYIIMLLLIGATWRPGVDLGLLFIPVYFLVRMGGKLVGTFVGTRLFRPRYAVPAHAGLGLLPEGGLSIAMVVSFALLCDAAIANLLITVIVFSVLLSDLLSPGIIASLFGSVERRD